MLSIHDGEIQARENDLDAAGTFTGDGVVADASVTHHDALLLPGGTVNPGRLRVDPDAVSFGDYHVARDVGWALTGEQFDDRRLAEFLEPWRPQRGRVPFLVAAAGLHRPRHGPRMAPRTHLPARLPGRSAGPRMH